MSGNDHDLYDVDVPIALRNALDDIPQDLRYVIALSGGLDSVVLLHLCVPFLRQRQVEIVPVHIHHDLSPNADDWARHCKKICKTLDLDCQVEKVSVRSSGEGLEAAARKARYAVFSRYLAEGGILLQGHHLNDQAETVLMRLIRGAGPEGLSGIPRVRSLSGGRVYRPWLSVPRETLELVAQGMGLEWVEDESNQDLGFDRNFIRHKVLPVLSGRWSTVLSSLDSVAHRASDAQALITAACARMMADVLSPAFRQDHALDLSRLGRLDQNQQHALVRFWFDQLDVPHPSRAIFARIWSELIPAAEDSQPLIQWGVHQLRRYQGCLFYVDADSFNTPSDSQSIDVNKADLPLPVPFGRRSLLLEKYPPGQAIPDGVSLLRWPDTDEVLHLATRQGGENFVPAGSNQHRPLKKVLQGEGVPPWRRADIPLLYYGESLAMAGLERIAEGYTAGIAKTALGISWLEISKDGNEM